MNIEALPRFPDLVPLELGHRALFEELARLHPPKISDLNFTDLWTWRHAFPVCLGRLRGSLCLCVTGGDQHRYFYPPWGGPESREALQDLTAWVRQQGSGIRVFGFTENETRELKSGDPGLDFEEIPDALDYVYLTRDLVELKGSPYARKRAHLAQFKKRYAYEAVPLTPDLLPECLEFQKQWAREWGETPTGLLREEHLMVMDLLGHFSELTVFGMVLRVDGRIGAFTVAEELDPETALVLVEKAERGITGAYEAVNQMFCERMPPGYTYVNRAQDMGDPGLRRSKLSYRPHHLVRKYVLSIPTVEQGAGSERNGPGLRWSLPDRSHEDHGQEQPACCCSGRKDHSSRGEGQG